MERSTGLIKHKEYKKKVPVLVKKKGKRKPLYRNKFPNTWLRVSFTPAEIDEHEEKQLRKKIAEHQAHQERVTLRSSKYNR